VGWAGSAILVSLLSAPAFGYNLGPHMADLATNPCKICHDTAAGAPALRGWAGAGAGPATGWGAKAISGLCYKCHDSVGGPFGPGHNMLANAYADISHGFVVAAAPEEPEGAKPGSGTYPSIAASGLPYASTVQLECTTCHNVHQAGNRPFNQRASLQELCEKCHGGRVANGALTRALPGLTRSYSTHPTRRALVDTARANIKAVADIAPALKVPTPAAPGWALGGHLNDTGDLDCQTCHAVHGPTQGFPGLQDLLAVDNATTDGTADPSLLCEGCHYGGAAGEQVGSVLLGEYSDHPIDASGNRPFYPTGVAIPAGWTAATTQNSDRGAQPFYTGVTKTPVCSSCHDTHGGISDTPLLRGPQASGAWAPMSYNDWCFACHAVAQVLPNAHHSVRGNLAVALGGPIDSQLSCGDCHGPVGSLSWTVHNGFWTFAIPVSAADSALCLGCHVADNPADLVSPGPKGQAFTEPANFPATHGTVRGTASHYLGPDSGEFAGVDPKLTAWSTGYFSSYGPPNTAGGGATAPAAAGEIICESCHDLLYNDGRANPGSYNPAKPETAGWMSNLLLERYEDDPPGVGVGVGSYAVGSALCTGCHGAGGNHHPLTGDIVPLSGLPLRTGAGSFADQLNAPVGGGPAPGTLSYPAPDAMDCDSCHRPHRADVDSDVVGAAHGSGTSGDGKPTLHILEVDGAGHRYSDLCLECHAR